MVTTYILLTAPTFYKTLLLFISSIGVETLPPCQRHLNWFLTLTFKIHYLHYSTTSASNGTGLLTWEESSRWISLYHSSQEYMTCIHCLTSRHQWRPYCILCLYHQWGYFIFTILLPLMQYCPLQSPAPCVTCSRSSYRCNSSNLPSPATTYCPTHRIPCEQWHCCVMEGDTNCHRKWCVSTSAFTSMFSLFLALISYLHLDLHDPECKHLTTYLWCWWWLSLASFYGSVSDF